MFLWIEVTFKSNTGGNAGILGCGHNQLSMSGILATGIGILLQGGGMGQLFDFVSSTFIGPSFPVSDPYTISVNLNQAAKTATFEFKDDVNPDQSGVASVNVGYDNTEFTYLFSITTGLGANDVVVIDMNGGSEAFILDNSDGKYCDYEFKIFCPFDNVTLHNQSGTVEAETGFINVEGSLATTDLILNTPVSATVGIAKSEIFFVSDVNASTSEKLSVAFVSANTASPTVFCELTIDPIQQTVFDSIASANVETGINMVAGIYKIWIELDLSNGTAIYTDILGNTGSLSVTGYTLGDDIFYRYKARADTLSNSKLVLGYNSGAIDFANGSGTGKCNL